VDTKTPWLKTFVGASINFLIRADLRGSEILPFTLHIAVI